MSIRYKMIIFISTIMLITVGMVSAIWYRDTQNLSDTYIESTAEDLMQNAYNAFDYILTDTEYLLSIIALNEDNIINPLEVINEENEKGSGNFTYDQLENIRIIEDYIGALYGHKYYVTGISVLDLDGNKYSMGHGHRYNSEIVNQLAVTSKEYERGQLIMLPPLSSEDTAKEKRGSFVLPVARAIKNKNDELVGYAVIYFDYVIIEEMFSDNLPLESQFKVEDDNGYIIFSNEYTKLDKDFVNSEYYAPKAGWRFTMAIPTEVIMKEINQTLKNTWLIFGGIYILLVIVSVIFVYGLTKRLRELSSAMDKVAKGNLDTQTEISTKDEIGEMSQSFNKMVVQINKLIDKVAEEEEKKREAEINFLQAQINPHFLSNVLNTVVWMAKIYNANNIIKLTQSLISLLRLVMRSGQELITVSEEIMHVKSYVKVIKYSATYDFNIEYDIDESLSNMKIQRFTLQPFVENAIVHGVSEEIENESIKIVIKKHEDNLSIIIEDNGKGMTKRQIEELLTIPEDKKDSINRIGIKNVNDRIHLSYGNEYGVQIDSELSNYTKVIIRLPLIE